MIYKTSAPRHPHEAFLGLSLIPTTNTFPPLDIMLSTVHKAGRAPALLRHGRRVPVQASQLRALTSGAQNTSIFQTQANAAQRLSSQKRWLSASAAAAAASQPAPDAKAYIQSGVVKPRDHVDVKKVLVIGSGGLAIGQAGEFDYSGMSNVLVTQ